MKWWFSARWLILVLILAVGTLGIQVFQEQSRWASVRSRADEFYGNLSQKRFGDLWEMESPDARKFETKEEFIASAQKFFQDDVFVIYEKPVVIEVKKQYAITTAMTTLFFKEDGHNNAIVECKKTVWVWKDKNWYFDTSGLRCDYEPTDIIKRLMRADH